MAVKTFCPQFQALLDNVEDEKIDELLHIAKTKIDYIENGVNPDE